tara:strand:- start:6 stop:824 length:819 start_codon:yes stop_codon:yes gene_type:complete
MSNHISAKFFGFVYSPVPSEVFSGRLPDLTNRLRRYLPRHEPHTISGFRLQVNESGVATQQINESHQELHMVDAQGLWGVKVGNTGVSFSASNYVSFEDSVTYIEEIVAIIAEVLEIYYFSRVSLRNINLFGLLPGEDNRFQDIQDESYWGRQEFETLQDGFVCNGASTRHEYFSHDYQTQIQLASGVVLRKQSYIPQDEWDIWKLRGGIPVQNESDAMLLIDINGTRSEAPMNVPDQQNNVTEYRWEHVRRSFELLHEVVNSVYFDITIKD